MSNRTENNNEGITKFNFCCAFISLTEFEQETNYLLFCYLLFYLIGHHQNPFKYVKSASKGCLKSLKVGEWN